jgi:broad specificity phosphatase PhoE
MTPDAPLRAALMRHAPTEWNRQGRIQGHRDSPLTPAGRRLAGAWALRLAEFDFHRVVTSDLGRARETAALLTHGRPLPLDADARLREQDWGAWTGMRMSAIRQRFPRELEHQERQEWRFRPPGGESRGEVAARGAAVLMALAVRWPGQRVLLVTHEGFMKCLLYHLILRRTPPDRNTRVRPYHLHWITVSQNDLLLEHLNALNLVAPAGGQEALRP